MTNSAAADMELATQVATAFLRRPVHAIAPIRGKGSVNLIFTAQARNAAVVVRMSKPEDAGRGLLFYEKEAWCLAHAAAAGIPGPQVLEIGRWDGRPYMLQTLVAGVNGEDSGGMKPHIWRVLGRYARKIHAIALDGFGESLADFQKGNAQAEWRAYVDYNLRSLTPDDPLLRLNVYRPDQADAIRHVFQTLREATVRIGLNHYDLAIRNTMVDAAGEVTPARLGIRRSAPSPTLRFAGDTAPAAPRRRALPRVLEGVRTGRRRVRRAAASGAQPGAAQGVRPDTLGA